MVKVCFVCFANICRSPTAEGIMRHLVDEAGLGDRIVIDSAGTSARYHAGRAADPRSRATAARSGIELSSRSRQIEAMDFYEFDYVVAMDSSNLDDLREIAPDEAALARLSLLRDHDPEAPADREVPDPYVGAAGFERVFTICLDGCRGLLARIRQEHAL